jgi:hypothetical protein
MIILKRHIDDAVGKGQITSEGIHIEIKAACRTSKIDGNIALGHAARPVDF